MATKKKAASKPAKAAKTVAETAKNASQDVSATLATTVWDSEKRKLDRIAADPFLKNY
jgi:hypothetical protein